MIKFEWAFEAAAAGDVPAPVVLILNVSTDSAVVQSHPMSAEWANCAGVSHRRNPVLPLTWGNMGRRGAPVLLQLPQWLSKCEVMLSK